MKRNWLGWIGCQFRKHKFSPGHWETIDGKQVYIPMTCTRCGLQPANKKKR